MGMLHFFDADSIAKYITFLTESSVGNISQFPRLTFKNCHLCDFLHILPSLQHYFLIESAQNWLQCSSWMILPRFGKIRPSLPNDLH